MPRNEVSHDFDLIIMCHPDVRNQSPLSKDHSTPRATMWGDILKILPRVLGDNGRVLTTTYLPEEKEQIVDHLQTTCLNVRSFENEILTVEIPKKRSVVLPNGVTGTVSECKGVRRDHFVVIAERAK